MSVFQKSNRLSELESLTKPNNEIKLDSVKLTKELQNLKQKSINLKSKRDKSVSIRLSQETFKQMKDIAEETNLSQADIITILLDNLIQKVGK